MSDPTNPVLGDFHIDGSEFAAYAEDVPDEVRRRFVCTHEGFEAACNEVVACQAECGKAAGISDSEATDLLECNERISRIDALLPVYEKAVEKLVETRAKLDDQRERILLNAAAAVDRRGIHNPMLLAKYEKTRAYRSAPAQKALKTKAQKAKQAAGSAAGSNGSAPS